MISAACFILFSVCVASRMGSLLMWGPAFKFGIPVWKHVEHFTLVPSDSSGAVRMSEGVWRRTGSTTYAFRSCQRIELGPHGLALLGELRWSKGQVTVRARVAAGDCLLTLYVILGCAAAIAEGVRQAAEGQARGLVFMMFGAGLAALLTWTVVTSARRDLLRLQQVYSAMKPMIS